ncbi:queuosine precursor transporter [Ancylobacter defluvii]|uniref:Probable queuosine precursor transporter n=1 Tax=Ancylobacter defluvii TaxID=1282440 RepID=A0A9W6NAA2_9HYPH|nr:queuosine precursor transporter [Ancylobacter defluvii]MBS7590459.1 queuosine precursor transporter [Ancylobacter defluvii]GLK83380.1 membrane protein [Ancylobacter defluvii]
MLIAGTRVSLRALVLPIAAMMAVVAASNVAVQYPVRLFGLEEALTWGAFTYPLAFLVNDLTNRRFGPAVTRRVVYAGFALAVLLSVWLATPRIALASGSAFLVGQLLDITVFNRLRRMSWWQAPLAGSLLGSALDTVLFFSLAFAGDADMSFPVTYASTGITVPLWVGLAYFDFLVKLGCALVALVPYGALMGRMKPWAAPNSTPMSGTSA